MASPTRWGIVSAGKISTDFCIALRTLDPTEHRIQAVAARSLDNAKQFAEKHSITKAYGSYEELSKDENIDVVYIGTIQTQHNRLCKLMLNAGKPVLCETPMGLSMRETQEVLDLAKEKNLFFMEAMWSRHLPIYENIRSLLSSGRIGDVELVTVQFGVDRLIDHERVGSKEIGVGIILEIAMYSIQVAVTAYGTQKPNITIKGKLSESGVDEAFTAILQYSNNRTAVLMLDGRMDLGNEAGLYGTKGMITISSPFWCPTKMIIKDGTGVEVVESTFPKGDMKTYYPNGEGLRYEAINVRKCLLEGKTQSEVMNHEDSLLIASIMERMRHSLGHTLPQEQETFVMLSQ